MEKVIYKVFSMLNVNFITHNFHSHSRVDTFFENGRLFDISKIKTNNHSMYVIGELQDTTFYVEDWIDDNRFGNKYFLRMEENKIYYSQYVPAIVNGKLSAIEDEKIEYRNLDNLLKYPCTNMARIMEHRKLNDVRFVVNLYPSENGINMEFNCDNCIVLEWNEFERYLHHTSIAEENCQVFLQNMDDFNCDDLNVLVSFVPIECPLWTFNKISSDNDYDCYLVTSTNKNTRLFPILR